MERIIFHIDVNSAYLSWSAIDLLKKNPDSVDIRTIPAIIGGNRKTRHGIVLAKSLPAKNRYHIHTAEPVANALKKCPTLTIIPPDHDSYSRHSKQFVGFLRSLTPEIEQVSVDECFLDYTTIASHFSSPEEGAAYIRNYIYEHFGFTVNVGISSNKVLAKMASDFEKPDKTHTLFPDEIQEKMWPLPISNLFMAGNSSVETLRKLEIQTIGDLAKADSKLIELHLKSHGRRLWEFANGMDDSIVESEKAEAKGVGNSTTLSKDVSTKEDAQKVLLSLAQSVGGRLRKHGYHAGVVNVEIKYADFTVNSHQKQLERMTASDQVIYQIAVELFCEMWNGKPIRLLGIRTSKLSQEGEPQQLSLFDLNFHSRENISEEVKSFENSQKHEKLDQALDEIRKKFGKDAVVRASFLKKPEKGEKM